MSKLIGVLSGLMVLAGMAPAARAEIAVPIPPPAGPFDFLVQPALSAGPNGITIAIPNGTAQAAGCYGRLTTALAPNGVPFLYDFWITPIPPLTTGYNVFVAPAGTAVMDAGIWVYCRYL